MRKPGIGVTIPCVGECRISVLISDYTGMGAAGQMLGDIQLALHKGPVDDQLCGLVPEAGWRRGDTQDRYLAECLQGSSIVLE